MKNGTRNGTTNGTEERNAGCWAIVMPILFVVLLFAVALLG